MKPYPKDKYLNAEELRALMLSMSASDWFKGQKAANEKVKAGEIAGGAYAIVDGEVIRAR